MRVLLAKLPPPKRTGFPSAASKQPANTSLQISSIPELAECENTQACEAASVVVASERRPTAVGVLQPQEGFYSWNRCRLASRMEREQGQTRRLKCGLRAIWLIAPTIEPLSAKQLIQGDVTVNHMTSCRGVPEIRQTPSRASGCFREILETHV